MIPTRKLANRMNYGIGKINNNKHLRSTDLNDSRDR